MTKIRSEAVCVYGAKIINTHVLAMQAEIEGVLEAKDIEYIHRMRVASRRLRSALAIFKGCLSSKDFKNFARDIRDVTRSLGAARDLDVQLGVLESVMPDFSDPKLIPGLRPGGSSCAKRVFFLLVRSPCAKGERLLEI